MSNVCKAKDKNNCRYHKPVDHARMEMVSAEAAYNDALVSGTTHKMSNRQLSEHKANLAVLKRKLVESQIEYATFDEGYAEVEAAIATASTAQIKHDLERRKMLADELRIEKEKSAKTAAVKAQRFEEIKKELNEYSATNSWRDGYARALLKVCSNGERFFKKMVLCFMMMYSRKNTPVKNIFTVVDKIEKQRNI